MSSMFLLCLNFYPSHAITHKDVVTKDVDQENAVESIYTTDLNQKLTACLYVSCSLRCLHNANGNVQGGAMSARK